MLSLALERRIGVRHNGEVLDDLLRVLCLARARLSGDENTLVLSFTYEVSKRLVGHSENVRFRVLAAPALVHVDIFVGVDGERAIRVDRDQEETRVCVYQIGLVARVEIMHHRRLVQMSQFGHIVCLIELGRIDFIDALVVDFALLLVVSALRDIPRA